jgi:hypothetical protein
MKLSILLAAAGVLGCAHAHPTDVDRSASDWPSVDGDVDAGALPAIQVAPSEPPEITVLVPSRGLSKDAGGPDDGGGPALDDAGVDAAASFAMPQPPKDSSVSMPEPSEQPEPSSKRACGGFPDGCPSGYPCLQPTGACVCWSGAPPSGEADPIPRCDR